MTELVFKIDIPFEQVHGVATHRHHLNVDVVYVMLHLLEVFTQPILHVVCGEVCFVCLKIEVLDKWLVKLQEVDFGSDMGLLKLFKLEFPLGQFFRVVFLQLKVVFYFLHLCGNLIINDDRLVYQI